MYDLREIARALDGEICGGQVVAPGPGHSRRDRSMSVRISASAPDGFLAHSHAGDDWRACRDHVRERLGIMRERTIVDNVHDCSGRRPRSDLLDNVQEVPPPERVKSAFELWTGSVDPIGTVVERYFASRRLEIGDLAVRVIRWNPRIGAMVCLFRSIRTGEPRSVSRTYLDTAARKIERKFLGPTKDAAVMLDAFDAVTHGLHVGEGVETCQAARQLGLRPTWALGSAGAIASFPLLGGIETLTILGEHDDASARATEACGARWHDAGREVLVTKPFRGKDLNDVLRGAV